jgi:hypothetical protein
MVFKTCNLPLTSQMKWNLSISSLAPLASLSHFKKIVPYHLDLEKYPKSIPKYYVHFLRLGMNLVMKTRSFDKNIYYNVHHINIEGWEKIKNYLQKQFKYFEIFEIYFSNCQNQRSNSSTCNCIAKHNISI